MGFIFFMLQNTQSQALNNTVFLLRIIGTVTKCSLNHQNKSILPINEDLNNFNFINFQLMTSLFNELKWTFQI